MVSLTKRTQKGIEWGFMIEFIVYIFGVTIVATRLFYGKFNNSHGKDCHTHPVKFTSSTDCYAGAPHCTCWMRQLLSILYATFWTITVPLLIIHHFSIPREVKRISKLAELNAEIKRKEKELGL